MNVGRKPTAVAVTPDWREVYIASDGDNTVSVLDTATNKVTATVNVGSEPSGVEIGKYGSKVYVRNTGDNTVSAIDAATNTVTTTLKLENNPEKKTFHSPESPTPMFDTITALTSSANRYTSGQPVTLTAIVGTKLDKTEKVSGTATFIDETTNIGNGTINSGQAILTTSALSVGSHSITAQYIGNNNFKPSTSPAFTLIVKKEPIFQYPLFPVACGIFVTVIGCFIRFKIQKKY